MLAVLVLINSHMTVTDENHLFICAFHLLKLCVLVVEHFFAPKKEIRHWNWTRDEKLAHNNNCENIYIRPLSFTLFSQPRLQPLFRPSINISPLFVRRGNFSEGMLGIFSAPLSFFITPHSNGNLDQSYCNWPLPDEYFSWKVRYFSVVFFSLLGQLNVRVSW